MQDHHLVYNILHYKSTNFYISFLLNFKNLTFNKYILVGSITSGKKLSQCQETVVSISQMEKQFYWDNIITLDDTPPTSSTSSTLPNRVSNKSLFQLESTLFYMASTPDLCEGVSYLFPIQIQNKFIIWYKTLKSFIIIFYLIQLFLNYFSFTFYLHTFITIADILRVVATEDLQIKLVNIFLQNNSMLALKTYFLSAYI